MGIKRPDPSGDLGVQQLRINSDAERDISQAVTQDLITRTHTQNVMTHTYLWYSPLFYNLLGCSFYIRSLKKKQLNHTQSHTSKFCVRTVFKSGHFIHSRPTEAWMTQHWRRSTQTENQRRKPLRH